MKRVIFVLLATAASPAFAQTMDPSMHGMDMGSHTAHHPTAAPIPPKPAQPAPASVVPAVTTDQGTPAAGEPTGTDQSPGSAEPPAVAHDRPADRYYDPQAMAAAEVAMMHPKAPSYAQARLDLAEYQFRNGRDGYRWEGEAWTGDLDRFVARARGEGSIGQRLDNAELQAVYSRALDPWWNLQAGIRQDIRPTPARSYASLGIEGMAPYMFDVLGQAFLSDKGQLTARIEASFDERITRRFVLQPRAEFNLSAQDMPAQRLGGGLNSAELGLRLRYEVSRQFAPYVGFSCTLATGKTADYVRAAGDAPHQRSVVIGFKGWF